MVLFKTQAVIPWTEVLLEKMDYLFEGFHLVVLCELVVLGIGGCVFTCET